MKKIRLRVSKIKNHFYAKIPDLIVKQMNLSNAHDIEVSIFDNKSDNQIEIWDAHPEDINIIKFMISNEVHTMNMYNKIYIPEKYRFFFPSNNKEFLLITNVGNIKTHLTSNGYFCKGLRQWFHVNGPLMPNDKMEIRLINENIFQYEMTYGKHENENNH